MKVRLPWGCPFTPPCRAADGRNQGNPFLPATLLLSWFPQCPSPPYLHRHLYKNWIVVPENCSHIQAMCMPPVGSLPGLSEQQSGQHLLRLPLRLVLRVSVGGQPEGSSCLTKDPGSCSHQRGSVTCCVSLYNCRQ